MRAYAIKTNDPVSFGFEDDRTMSRIGRKPVPVPPSVKVSIAESTIEIEGPKGKLSFKHRPEIDVAFDQAGGADRREPSR